MSSGECQEEEVKWRTSRAGGQVEEKEQNFKLSQLSPHKALNKAGQATGSDLERSNNIYLLMSYIGA